MIIFVGTTILSVIAYATYAVAFSTKSVVDLYSRAPWG
jgi:hypothetical protein